MNTAYHALVLLNASEVETRRAIDSWFSANGFTRTSAIDGTPMRASRGSVIGITDHQTARMIEVIVKAQRDVVAVSVSHRTTGFIFFQGTMLGNILQSEAEALLEFIRQEVDPRALKR